MVSDHEGTHVAVGGTLFGIGWGSILTLLIAAGATTKNVLTDRWWYLPAVGISSFFMLVGVWFAAGVYLPWLRLPRTWHEREMAPDLRIERVTILDVSHTLGAGWMILFHIGFQNHGRGDVPNVGLNVVLPDLVSGFRVCDMFGNETPVGHFGKSEESLQDDDQGHPLPSLVWGNTGITFYGKTAAPIYFKVFQVEPVPFRVRVQANSSALSEPLGGTYDLDPRVTP